MAAEKGPTEPSMEEILASIRRIISDEKEDEAKEEGIEDAAADATPAAPSAAKPPEEEILLTDVVETTTIDLSGDAPAAPEAAAEPVIEKTAPPPPPPAPTPKAEAPAAPPPPAKKEEVPVPAKPAAPTVAAKPPAKVPEDFDVSETVAENKKLADTYRGLVSPPIAEKSTLTFAALADAIHARGTPLGKTDMTLEDLIRDLLRPHLKEWLDTHLPGVVEKLVRAEIERMTREAEERKDLI